jgi:hypothetical protein
MSLLLLSYCYTFTFSLTDSNAQIDSTTERATFKNSDHRKMEAYGRIATSQTQNGSISWIQAGLWYMTITLNDSDNNNKDAYFYTDFTMVKPDGTSLHNHFIKNFRSTIVQVNEEKTTIEGIADIYSGQLLEYQDVPVVVYLKNKTVLGLIIDKDKTQQHFASSSVNEIFGILINSRSLANSYLKKIQF